MDIEIVIQSEVNQKEKNKYGFPFLSLKKNGDNFPISLMWAGPVHFF